MRILTFILCLLSVSVFADPITPDEIKYVKEKIEAQKIKAQQGDPEAQNELGMYYKSGIYEKENLVEAVKWFRMSAEQGNADGQYCLGIAYYKGEGVLKDVDEAFKYIKKSAEQGLSVSQSWLGIFYTDDIGVPNNILEAYAYLNLAGVTDESARNKRDELERRMSTAQIKAGVKRSKELQAEIEAKIADKKKAEKK